MAQAGVGLPPLGALRHGSFRRRDRPSVLAVRVNAMWKWTGGARPPFATEPGEGQESVWDYPRPPRIERDERTVVVRAGVALIAETNAALRDHVGFYPGRVACSVGGIRVEPQPGAFYAGWITPEIVGPWKGDAGTDGW